MRRIDGQVCGLREFRDHRLWDRSQPAALWLADPLSVRASPALCKIVLRRKIPTCRRSATAPSTRPTRDLAAWGDIGYQNSREEGLGIKACYDDLPCYADSLLRATMTPAEHGNARCAVGDEYRQLSASILQIENSTTAPCAEAGAGGAGKPSLALKKRGVRYIELRSLDVNAYHPLGLDETQGPFLEVFLLFCLLAESPVIDDCERREIDRNLPMWLHRKGANRG